MVVNSGSTARSLLASIILILSKTRTVRSIDIMSEAQVGNNIHGSATASIEKINWGSRGALLFGRFA